MRKFKKTVSVLLSLVMVLGMFAVVPFTVGAQEAVTYTEYSWNDSALETTEKTVTDYTVVTSSLSSMTSGTYVVNADTTIENYVTVQKGKTANLIVMDGVTLTCKKGIGCGLNKDNKYASLNIYGTGKIVATGKSKAAGIGGDDDETNGNITIHGTTIEATGGKHGAGVGGGEGGKDPNDEVSIKIFAGDITATGGIDAAGIGGGDEQQGAKTYIYSGKITASSEKHGAGIGGGDEENTRGIYIYGGKTEAKGGGHGAGIGAGEHGGNIHEIKIMGGEIEARGGSGGAGIGGGFDEDMSGEIDISGDVKLTAIAGEGGAGIGAGAGAEWNPNGDMDGTIRINCGAGSVISVYGLSKKLHNYGTAMFSSTYNKEFRGYNGAGIGAGYGGNMGGKVYLTGGNMWIWSGVGGAGIGGGCENWKTGGEGGDVYIGGGNINVYAIIYSAGGSNTFGDQTHNSAIGAGDNDFTEGSVYINANNNTTGKYMKVIREPLGDFMDDFKPEVTEIAADRSKKCHTTSWLTISECDHKDHNGNSGLTYTIDGDTHTVKCKYCGYQVTEAHSGSDCECGYQSDTCTVRISDDSGLTSATVARNGEFTLPADGGRVLSSNTSPSLYYRVKGWKQIGDASGKVYEPGETVTVDRNMTFTSEREYLYQVSFDEIAHGSIHADITNNEAYTTAGETLEFGVEADPGYSVNKVTYKMMTGYYLDDSYNIVYQYSDPVEMQPVDGKYQLTMPEFSASYNNRIVISAEVSENTVNPIYISENIENGTVTSDKETAAPNDSVTLTVTPDEGCFLDELRCKATDGTELELTQTDDTHYTFSMPAYPVSVTAAFPDNFGTHLAGHSISLDGDIAVNFYMHIDPEITSHEGVVMQFCVPDTSTEYQYQEIEVSDNIKVGNYYVFKCRVAAKNMDSVISAQLVDGSNKSIVYTYSVKEYADYLLDNAAENGTAEEKAYAKAAPLVRAMLTYGDNAKYYSGGDTEPEQINTDIPEYTSTVAPFAESIFDGATLSLKSQTTLSLYFVSAQDITLSMDGKNEGVDYETDHKGNEYVIRIRNIAIKDLNEYITIKVNGQDAVTYSPRTYCYKAQTSSDAKLVNTAKALYLYWQAADEYFD